MALVVADRVRETSTTTSTGTYTLAGAVIGHQAFSAVGDGNTTYYCVTDGTDWETGTGTYTASGTTLARTTIHASTNGGAAVDWPTGTRNVYGYLPATILDSLLSGGVVGPASATDNTFPRYNTTTGQLIQSGQTSEDDSGNVIVAGNITSGGTVDGRTMSTDGSKLDGIETGADVTNATNVTSAGALMDSEVDADIKTLSLPASTTISAFGATLVDDASASAARTTLGLEIGTDVVAYPGGSGDLVSTNDLSDLSDAATARTNLGLEIGTDVQAYTSVLAATTASFLTADETKLDGIEDSADVTDTANVTSAGALMDSEVDADIKTLTLPASTTISVFGASLVDDAAASNARTTLGLVIGTDVQAYSAVLAATTASFTTADETKLDAITGTNTGDEPAASTTVPGIVELATIAEVDTGTDTTRAVTPDALEGSALQTKVDGIEALADVTDTANVTAAGALMDSEVDADIKTLTLPASTTISTWGASFIDDTTASAARTTLGVAIGVDVQNHSSVLDATTASYTTALDTKLDGIETGADVTDTTNVTAAGALMDSELAGIAAVKATTGTFLTADQTKLDGIETNADVTNATNVAAAGALMDSEVDADIKTLSLPASTTISSFGASLIDDAAASNARTTLGLEIGVDVVAYPGSSGDFVSTNDLSDVSDAATARTNLGLEIGTDVVAYPGGTGAPDAVLEDQKSEGTNGGTSSSAAWDTRDLNTEVRNIDSILSLSSNAFTPSQDGWVEFMTTMYSNESGRARLQNITDGTTAGVGVNAHAPTAVNANLYGGAAVEADKEYELQSWEKYGAASIGLGYAPYTGHSTSEIYSRIIYWKT